MTNSKDQTEHFRLLALSRTPPEHVVSREDRRILVERGYWQIRAEGTQGPQGIKIKLIVEPGPLTKTDGKRAPGKDRDGTNN